jgi:DNA-binding Lrp family transcriptional regulator
MSDIDKRILQALKAETDAPMHDYERELGLFGLMARASKVSSVGP